MALIDLIKPECIKVPLVSTMKNDILRELIQVLKDAGKIDAVEAAFLDVRAREDKGSTGLADGIAIPHTKTTQVKNLTLAIGIAPQGVDFDSLDGKPSKVFFLMLAAPNEAGPHIEALSEIARVTISTTFVRLLSSARTVEEVVELFQG
ncbi:MAG: PTS sugar transporter subunit IIA [Spirochaetales bacterium]|nr:PTS sugar transporter subunit IIA [Spirochaetales bacterium]